MRAVLQERFGPPDVLRIGEVAEPAIEPDEVLLRVRAAALNPYDWHVLRGDPKLARLAGIGLRRPRARVAGVDVAGTVVQVGADVTDLRVGQEVLGSCAGALADLAAAKADALVPRPEDLPVTHAAGVTMAGTTALRAIRHTGRVSGGQRVLVNGAAGGIGCFAVQIAVAAGAEVTGVCSRGAADLVRTLGANEVIDYTQESFTDRVGRYDVILDNVGNHSLGSLRRALTPHGVLLLNGGGAPGEIVGPFRTLLQAAVTDRFVRQSLRFVPTRQTRGQLVEVVDLVAAGSLRVVVDRVYPLVDVAEALRHVERGHSHGKVVVTLE